MAIDQDKLEISKEKDKQEQLQKIKEDADLWEERRNKLKDKAMEISADPQAWLKGFLMKKAAEAGHYAISKKRRLEVAEAKEKESLITKKDNSDRLKTAVELKKLEIEPSEIKFGFEAAQLSHMVEGIEGLTSILEDIRDLSVEQLKTDKNQFKADNRTSAAEEAAGAGSKIGIGGVLTTDTGSSDKNKSVVEDGVDGIMSTIQDVVTEGVGGVLAERAMGGLSSGTPDKKPSPKTKAGGLKGILKNIMAKFGKAGKFLMSLGSRFLLPLITTPAGWAVLAGLAVGGLVFAYWDDIVSFVGKMFDGVKSMFSKVVSKISGMFSAVGDAIKEVISFFNPMNLYPMIARALLPKGMYDAVSSFFGGDTHEERDNRGNRDEAGQKLKEAESDANEAEYQHMEAIDRQQEASSDLSDLKTATAVGIFPDGSQSILRITDNGRHNVPEAEKRILKAGARVATPDEVATLKASAEDKLAVADMNVEHLGLKSIAADKKVALAFDEHKELDDLVKGSDQKKKTPGNVVADLDRAGIIDFVPFWGESSIKNWHALQKLDYGTLEKVLAFDDWSDKTKKGILGIMNSKKQLIGANDLEPIKPNENSVLRKNEMVSGALQKGMDNKISQGSGNWGKKPSSTNIVSSPTVNNTTIKKEVPFDTDITSMSLNKSAVMVPE
jgi:hypothetical protein